MTQVLGIHGEGSELWIQMACAENPQLSVVLHIGPATRIEEVVERLTTDPPQDGRSRSSPLPPRPIGRWLTRRRWPAPPGSRISSGATHQNVGRAMSGEPA